MTRNKRLNVFIAPSGEVYQTYKPDFEEVPPSIVAFTRADQVDRSKVYRQQTKRLIRELSKHQPKR